MLLRYLTTVTIIVITTYLPWNILLLQFFFLLADESPNCSKILKKTWFNELYSRTKESGDPGELICMKAGTANIEIKKWGIFSLKILSDQRYMMRKINLYGGTHTVKQLKNIGRKDDAIKKNFVSNF